MTPSVRLYRLVYSFSFLVVLSALFSIWHLTPRAESASESKEKIDNPDAGISNYDLRLDKSAEAKPKREMLIAGTGRNSLEISAARKRAGAAADDLQALTPTLKIEYGEDLGAPEVIAPEALLKTEFLTAPQSGKRTDILKNFLSRNAALFGLDEAQIGKLETTADYTNPNGILSFVHFSQKFNGVPVFRGEVKAGFTKRGEIVRVINNLAPALDENALSTDFGSPAQAVAHAAKNIGRETNEADLKRVDSASDDLKVVFERGRFGDVVTAQKTYFPLDYGSARAAWGVLLSTGREAFYLVVDAASGELLWRKNLTESQTQTATYNVYGNATSMMKTQDSPTPSTPSCNMLPCPQPPIVARQSFTLIGNEPPYNFNGSGWIPDGENRTIGNNAEAGIDRDGVNGIDPNGWAFGNPTRNFVYAYNPAPGMPPPGEEPVPPAPQPYPPTAFQQGSVTNAFYTVNRWHDETYRLGFTEQARNFQLDNFGRGGQGNDPISVHVQDSSGTNGASFLSLPDGSAGTLQLFIWTDPAPDRPDRDGALDNQIIVHELTHGLTNRLHGNSGGLTNNMSRGMGEGWSDFYNLALLSEPTDDVNGIYPTGCYSIATIANCYHGIRRFPNARLSTVGPNGLPHNPLTFRYLNTGCDTLIGTPTTNPNSAYPRNPAIATGGNCDQIHNAGEIWSSTLWEVRGFLIDAHGAAEGNRRALQYITDGMKLSPIGPTMLQSRDAILAATMAIDSSDVVHVWRGFARRGMGFSASVPNVSPANVVEAFDTPNVVVGAGFSVSDAPGNNNGYPEPGEPLALTIPLTNNSGVAITGVTLQVAGGGSASYGDIANGQTVVRTVSFTVPANAPCPGEYVLTFNINGGSGSRSETRAIFLGVPIGGPPVTFTSNTPVTINDNAPATPYSTAINVSGLSGNKKIKLELTGVTHTFPSDIDLLLVGPGGQKFTAVSDSGNGGDVSNLTFTLADGASALPSTTQWTTGEFKPHNVDTTTDDFPAPAPAAPYSNPAPAGAATFANVFGSNSTNLNGTWTLWVRDDAGTDFGSMAGWKLTFESNDYTCIVCSCLGNARADFDGDGKTDLSVFRPGEGNWYVNRSVAGFMAINWGLAGDRLTPGDFDGDNKTDFAVFRPSADGSQPDFYVLNSQNFTYSGYSWGLPGDVPVIQDYEGDGKSDVTVFRPSNHTFYVLKSSNSSAQIFSAIQNGIPVAGDFDGDGKGDFVTYNVNSWLMARSTTNYSTIDFVQWGADGDKPVAADYDGDSKDDLAVFRPSDRTWYVRGSAGVNIIVPFGLANDVPVPGDYDGDAKDDIAVYRDGVWYILRSALGIQISQFGLAGDIPVANRYLP